MNMIDSGGQHQSNKQKVLERKLRSWLSKKCSPCMAVFATQELTEFMRENAALSPAEYLRPFVEVGNLDGRQIQTLDKGQPFKLSNFRLNVVDVNKIDHRYYKDSEYSGLFQYILDIEKPKSLQFETTLNQMKGDGRSLREAQKDLDKFIVSASGPDGTLPITPWYYKWKKWFLDKTRFKDHELIDQPIAFAFFVMESEPDPLRTIAQLRKDLPSQYKSQANQPPVYSDSTPNKIIEMVFVLNATGSSTAYQDIHHTLKQQFSSELIFEIPMSNRHAAAQGDTGPQEPVEDLWVDKYIDLDARNLIDMQVAMTEPSARKIRGRVFSASDRQKIRTQMKKIMETRLIPFMRQRIKILEESVAKTRKGIKNSIMNVFKKPERNENDGLKGGFKMNKAEIELRNLCDLSFVMQDYETASQNAQYPLKDFKMCKAFKYAASCLEVQLLSQVAYDLSNGYPTQVQQLEVQAREAYNLYHNSYQSDLLIKYAIMISELYEILERIDLSAWYMSRIAYEIQGAPILIALFFEQAALQYLQLKKYRKFAFFMIQAGMNFNSADQTEYAMNCYMLIHPFYQAQQGWHQIRFLVYSNLGAFNLEFRNQPIVMDFFRNYLKLCTEVDDQNQQGKYLRACLASIKSYLDKIQIQPKESTDLLQIEERGKNDGILYTGELDIPLILEDQIEVFVESEKLYSNQKQLYIANKFQNLPRQEDSTDREIVQITMKTDLNENSCQWKHMAKSVCDYAKAHKADNRQEDIPDRLGELNVDEITEFAIYDASSMQGRKELVQKKTRIVFVNTPITIRLMLKNTLTSTKIDVKNIKIVCKFNTDEGEQQPADPSQLYFQEPQNLTIAAMKQKEVILQVTPKTTGQFEIQRVEWELFDIVRGCHSLEGLEPINVGTSGKRPTENDSLKFKVIEESGEIEANLTLQSQNLHSDLNMIYTECKDGAISIKNLSEYQIKNAFVSCSHPLMLNFENKMLFGSLEKGEEVNIPIKLRVSLIQSTTIKFLVRYEVAKGTADGLDAQNNSSRFRFTRLMVTINGEQGFVPRYRINMSSINPKTHLVNMTFLDRTNYHDGKRSELPIIEAIEIVNAKLNWKLTSRDSQGRFFSVEEAQNQLESAQILRYNPQIVSVVKDEQLTAFLEKEINYLKEHNQDIDCGDPSKQVNFILHWFMPQENRRGFFCSYKQNLFPSSANLHESVRNPLQIAYDHQKEIFVHSESELPLLIPLNLTLTPLVGNIQGIRVIARDDGDDVDCLSWTGKVDHRISIDQEQEQAEADASMASEKRPRSESPQKVMPQELKKNPKSINVILTAVVHEVGVFDLNHLGIEVTIKGHNLPVQVKVKDEMIVQVNYSRSMMTDGGEMDNQIQTNQLLLDI